MGAAAVALASAVAAVPSAARPPALALGTITRVTTPGTTLCPAEGEPEVTVTELGTWVAYNDDHQCPLLPTLTRIEELQLIPRQGPVTFIPLDPPAGQVVSGDPDLTPAPDGGVYISSLWSGAANEGFSVRVLHVDRQLHVTSLRTPSLHHANNSDDKEFIAADNRGDSPYRGRLYVVWDDFDTAQTVVRAWSHGRWLRPAKLQSGIGTPDVAVGPRGEVAVTYQTDEGAAVRVSHNGGHTFGPALLVIRGSDPGYIDPSCPLRPTVGVRQRALLGPRVAFDRAGDLHVVAAVGHWQDVSSTDAATQGLLGAAVVRHAVVRAGHVAHVESVTSPSTDEQWMASLAALPKGGVAVSWLQTNAPAYTTYDAWIATEPPGARRFTPAQRLSVTSSMFPAATEAEGNSNCYGIGDYIGMSQSRTGVVTVWPTTDGDTPGVDSDVLVRPAWVV